MSLSFFIHAICQPASLIMLGFGAAIDLKDRVIPNELVVAIAVIGVIQGLALRPGAFWLSLLVAIIVFFGLWIFAHFKIIGGGDLKLISAATLLVPPDRVGQLLIDIVLAGGGLSCVYLAARYGLKRLPAPRPAAAEAAPSARTSGFVRAIKAERIRIGGGYPMPYAVAVLGGVIIYSAMEFFQR
ncbi:MULTISPECIES: A24 family peptidase [unclassified Bradyrhizobium]|uniref:A24 family peptidase n=1 Tax=unclassified Bradyrhizobium TaxID=2631580 RepID=UPI0028E3C018|nr:MULTISPECIES: A24 family peptidase [unclassified Bradyrhizobium]